MANRNFPQARIFGMNLKPVVLNMTVSIGASGAPTIVAPGTLSGQPGIASITRLSAGTYQIQLQDNYATFLNLFASFESPVSGSAVNMGSLSTATVYQIVTLGTSTQAQWITAGVPAGITAAPGVVFKAAGAGAGNGTVKILASAGITSVEKIGTPGSMLSKQPFVAGSGGYITFRCYGPTASGDTTPVATDPASGSYMFIHLLLNDSQLQ